MSKSPKSQWDFGELFPTETKAPSAPENISLPLAHRHVLTVGELTGQVKRLLEKQVGEVWVTGEVTNFRNQSSGHSYFTIKDAESQLNCVLFRDEARASRQLLQDGRKVVLCGTLTVYEPRGQYQLRVTAVELQGIGALQAAFERLKEKLKGEGLFASERKRVLPRYPERIGIITSLTGAAIRDVLHVIQRRHPRLEIVIAHCRVQGQGAGEEIAASIRFLNEHHATKLAAGLDLILVTRGGGSLEDLWAFNEEAVARAIFDSVLPVVSAVGHEIDFSISDFVADLRAATPSAAAELITEGLFSSRDFVAFVEIRLGQLARQQCESKHHELFQLAERLRRLHPRRLINENLQRLDDLQYSLHRQARRNLDDRKIEGSVLINRLARLNPRDHVKRQNEKFGSLKKAFAKISRERLNHCKKELAHLQMQLRLLGPKQVLARGYSITTISETGKIVRAANQVRPGDKLRTILNAGEIISEVSKNNSGDQKCGPKARSSHRH